MSVVFPEPLALEAGEHGRAQLCDLRMQTAERLLVLLGYVLERAARQLLQLFIRRFVVRICKVAVRCRCAFEPSTPVAAQRSSSLRTVASNSAGRNGF